MAHTHTSVSCALLSVPHANNKLTPTPYKPPHRDRLAAMKQEAEKRLELERQGHGTYSEISEADFLETVTKTENVVVHFYHKVGASCVGGLSTAGVGTGVGSRGGSMCA